MLAIDHAYIKVKDTNSCPRGNCNLVKNIDTAIVNYKIKWN